MAVSQFRVILKGGGGGGNWALIVIILSTFSASASIFQNIIVNESRVIFMNTHATGSGRCVTGRDHSYCCKTSHGYHLDYSIISF